MWGNRKSARSVLPANIQSSPQHPAARPTSFTLTIIPSSLLIFKGPYYFSLSLLLLPLVMSLRVSSEGTLSDEANKVKDKAN